MKDQQYTPLFEAVINYAKEQKVSFHTPGHKHGVSIPQEFINFVGEHIFDCDLTLLEEVDSLHDPKSVIKEAQELAAQAYDADVALFLVNGTSSGNQTMLLTVCDPGDKIIVPRNAHRSVLAGIILSGAVPVYVMPHRDKVSKQLLNIAAKDVKEAIAKNPDAKAVLVTSPSYAGLCADLEKIAEITHEAGMLFLVDEAHGPHLHFHPDLPKDAIASGADMCIQSTHKILSSLTQASMLLAKKTVDTNKLKKVHSLLTTTSPSYILMASLDIARMQMATRGKELLDTTIALAQKLRTKMNDIDGVRCFGREILGQPGASDLDDTKLVISFPGYNITGYEVARQLNRKYKIQVEFADADTILLIVSVGNTYKDCSKIVKAFNEMVTTFEPMAKSKLYNNGFPMELPEMVLTPRDAVFADNIVVDIDQAVGQISVEAFSPYPPGIPVVNPGERFSVKLINYLKRLHREGSRIQGQSDEELRTVKIVSDPNEVISLDSGLVPEKL